MKVSPQLDKNGLSCGFLVAIIVKDEFPFVIPFPVAVNFLGIHLLIGFQLFENIAVLLFTRTFKVGDVIFYVYLFHIVFH